MNRVIVTLAVGAIAAATITAFERGRQIRQIIKNRR